MPSSKIYEPLHWSDGFNQKNKRALFNFSLFSKEEKEYRGIIKQLKNRDFYAISCWDKELLNYFSVVSNIIREYMKWPNIFYLPEDSCAILFYDPSSSLLAVEALLVISDIFCLSDDVLDNYNSLNYEQLLRVIKDCTGSKDSVV